ncbi:aromatic ring-hydroxylating dioxygenase subunit alpha [Nostoc sp. FACHB-190]|uniref:aromatic ring-hydroxylating oxygenase subunit alpha n=1 Tax=Nostoc sp. FACHB-190 TaxID=2692838 RepID=UPI001F5547C7|nr:aromatic ring-hydroxylating dioxygenase subunit alpha [Nostoc sp. FACHB-190]
MMNIFSHPSLVDETTSSHQAKVGLPGNYYFSEQIFAYEQQTIWRKTWQFVGRESDLANPGDYLTCQVGDQPMFVIRDNHGKLRTMHNVCPHRGARMLEGQGNCQRVRCPYHGWNFNYEGNLKGLPRAECFPNLDPSAVYLAKGRVEIWGGFIFVHPESQGESLVSYLAGFSDYLNQYKHSWEELQQVDHWFYEEPANWKFPIENYLECYHLSVVHAQSLKCFDPKNIIYTPTGRHYQIFVPFTDDEFVKNHPAFSGEPKGQSYQGFIFPNMMVNTAKDKVSVFKLTPLSPTRTKFEVFIYQTKAQIEEFPYQIEKFRTEFERVLNEDFRVVRSLQASVHSQAYGVLQLADIEYGISHFHQVLSGYYQP